MAPVASVYSSDDNNINTKNNNINTPSPTTNNISMQQNNFTSTEYRPSSPTKYKIPDQISLAKQNSGVFISDGPNNPPFNQNEMDAVNAVLNENNTSNLTRRTTQRPSTSYVTNRTPINNNSSNSNTPQYQRSNTQAVLTRPSSRTLIGNLVKPTNGTGSRPNSSLPTATPHPTCGHHNAGQELCYLCHQRSRRNVPVYLHEEMRQKELEEDQLLMQYQSLKDMEKILKDEEKRNQLRSDRAKIDAFNLGVSQAVKEKLSQRPRTSDISVIIFNSILIIIHFKIKSFLYL